MKPFTNCSNAEQPSSLIWVMTTCKHHQAAQEGWCAEFAIVTVQPRQHRFYFSSCT